MDTAPETGPDELAQALRALVEPLVDVDMRLPVRLLDFVLQGGSEGVLVLLAPPRTGGSDSEEKQRFRALHARIGAYGVGTTDDDRIAQRRFYRALAGSASEIQLRWQQVLLVLSPQVADDPLPMSALLSGLDTAFDGHEEGVPFEHARLERLLEADGQAPEAVLTTVLGAAHEHEFYAAREILVRMPGYDDALVRHRDVLVAAMREGTGSGRTGALEMLKGRPPEVIGRYADVVAEFAVRGSAKVRTAASEVLADAPAGVVDAELWRLARDGGPGERGHALRLLHAHAADEATRSQVLQTARADRAQSVRRVARDLPVETAPLPPSSPRVPRPDWAVDRTPELYAALTGLRDDVDLAVAEWRLMADRGIGARTAGPHALGEDGLIDLGSAVLDGGRHAAPNEPRVRSWLLRPIHFERFAQRDGVSLAALLRALRWFGVLDDNGSLHEIAVAALDAHYDAGPHRMTLAEVAAALADLGLPATAVVEAWCRDDLAKAWARADVAPFVEQHLPTILRLAEERTDHPPRERAGLSTMLGALLTPPERVVGYLATTAVRGPREVQVASRVALGDGADAERAVVQAIGHARAPIRSAGAQWAAEARLSGAVPALGRAIRKEKIDAARAAQLDALEALGQSVRDHVDRDGLVEAARRAATEPLPDGLDWFPWSRLPPVRWADTGTPVPPEVIRAQLVRSVRSKSPRPDVLLRRYCSMYEPADRHRLGEFVAQSWIDADLAEVRRLTRDDEPILDPRVGSLIAAKGVLALAAACAGGEVTAAVRSYLNEWYGMRAAQCKALLAMLVWVDDPRAVNLLLAVGRRFRTPTIRKEAASLIDEMAQHRGWTREQLADRVIPHDATGRERRSVQREQTARLYEAMAAGRCWTRDDWQSFVGHPVIGSLVSGLVWRAVTDGAEPVIFTLGPAGQATTVSGEPVAIASDAMISLVHGSQLDEATVAEWTQWLSGRDCPPVLTQFERGRHEVPPGQRRSTELVDFTGCLLTGFTLRNRAKKLGYQRGPAVEGGWFVRYEKTLPACAVTVAIHFSGNVLPEENMRVALGSVRFHRAEPGEDSSLLRLEEVPPVLLAEAYHDAADIAGPGNLPAADWVEQVRRS